MNKLERITKNINSNKELMRNINDCNGYVDTEQDRVDIFIENVQRYIKAIKEGRIICDIAKVSQSGMSRNIKFLECAKGRDRHNWLNFWSLFKMLGYTEVKNDYTFRINGCGMDMIFHTNYTNMHQFKRLGFISNKQCEKYAQMTPNVI